MGLDILLVSHVLFFFCLVFYGWVRWGDLGDRLYEVRKSLERNVNLKKWSGKKQFVKWMRKFVFRMLLFVCVLYCFVLVCSTAAK